jgi:hypothetical protein
MAFSYTGCFCATTPLPCAVVDSRCFKRWLKRSKAANQETLMNTPQTPRQKETAAVSKGMPARQPKPDKAAVERAPTPHDASVEASLSLPHERDQSTDMTADTPDAVVQQAQRDVKHGLKDTSKAPEMNRAYSKLK